MSNISRLLLPTSMLIFGLINVLLGKDLNWDLGNYHYYNVFAFFYDRYDKDFWPTSLNTYLNPTLDFLTYFLINYFPPKLAAFTQGAIHGIAIWLLFKINVLFLPKNNASFILALVVTAFAAYSPMFIYGMGTFMGDVTISIFVLGFFYISCQALLYKKGIFYWLLSGFILGLGAGLKLTISFHVIAAAVSLLWLINLRNTFFWGIGILCGFALTTGYWFIFLWKKFQNPVFPFFNTLFHSSFFAETSWHDSRFFPQTIWETIFYPFFFSINGRRVLDIFFIDLRFAILYALLILAVILYISRSVKLILSPIEKWLLLFFILSYIFWEMSFSMLRYAIVLEMLTPLLIVLILKKLISKPFYQLLSILFVLMTIWRFLYTIPLERGPWNTDTYFGFESSARVKEIKTGLVLFPIKNYYVSNVPLSIGYLIPFFQPSDLNFVGIPYGVPIDFFSPKIRTILAEYKGPIYFMASHIDMPNFIHDLAFYHVTPMNSCDEIQVAHGRFREHRIFFCDAKFNHI